VVNLKGTALFTGVSGNGRKLDGKRGGMDRRGNSRYALAVRRESAYAQRACEVASTTSLSAMSVEVKIKTREPAER